MKQKILRIGILFTMLWATTAFAKTDTKPEKLEYNSLFELSGKTIAVQTGAVLDIMIKEIIPDMDYRYYNARSDLIEAVKNNKADAMPADEPVARLAVSKNPTLGLLPERAVADYYGIALQKNSPLTDEINQALKQLRDEGTLDQMKDKWTGLDDSIKILPELDYPGSNGVLRVAHDTAAEPMCYVGEGGQSTGYDLEMMLRIGQILDRKVEFTRMDFGALIPMLQSGKADVAVGSMSITEERKKSVDMSEAYYDGGVYLVVRKVEPNIVEKSFLDGLKHSFTRTFITESRWKLVLDGLGITVLLSILSGVVGTMLGFAICMMRRSGQRLISTLAAGFIRIVQGTPIVVLLMILYYVIFGKMNISAILIAVVGFSINFAAYVSEMMRTGIEAVDEGQVEAAHAIGFTRVEAFWKIIFPQAARHFLPVFRGEFVSMVKMTSVVGYIAIQDLTKASDIIRSRTLEAFFPLIATAIIYFLVANILTLLLSKVEIQLDPKRRKRIIKGVRV